MGCVLYWSSHRRTHLSWMIYGAFAATKIKLHYFNYLNYYCVRKLIGLADGFLSAYYISAMPLFSFHLAHFKRFCLFEYLNIFSIIKSTYKYIIYRRKYDSDGGCER